MTAIVLKCRECCGGKHTREAVCIDCCEIMYTCIAKDTPLHLIPQSGGGCEKVSYDEVTDATKAEVAFIGIAKISHLRRQKVISQVNKALMPIVEDDSNFKTQHLPYLAQSLPRHLKTWWTKSKQCGFT